MRILHLSKFYPPDPGGLEQVVGTVADGAARAGHDVRVICARGAKWGGPGAAGHHDPIRNGVSVRRLITLGIWWSQPLVPGYVWASRWRADVVYLHRPHPLADLGALVHAKGKVVVFHHSDVQRQRALRAAYQPLAHMVTRRAGAVVVATRAHLRQAQDLGPAGRDLARVIPYGVDPVVFAPTDDVDPPQPFRQLGSGPVALFVGRLVSYKGLDVLLDAVSDTKLRLVIVGEGPLRPGLAAEIGRRRMGDRVILAGSIPDADLPRYHQAADYFVLPSTSPAEMFGVVLLEAMACGKPIVTTALDSGVREVTDPDVVGLEVPVGDAAALRAAMLRLADDPELRKRLGEAGRRRVLGHFTIDGMVEQHLALCREIQNR